MADIFVAFDPQDEVRAREIVKGLKALKFSVKTDSAQDGDGVFGDKDARETIAAKAVIVLWSKAAAVSDWVRAAASIGRGRGVLIETALEECAPPEPFAIGGGLPLPAELPEQSEEWRSLGAMTARLTGRPGLPAYMALKAEKADKNAIASWADRWAEDPLAVDMARKAAAAERRAQMRLGGPAGAAVAEAGEETDSGHEPSAAAEIGGLLGALAADRAAAQAMEISRDVEAEDAAMGAGAAADLALAMPVAELAAEERAAPMRLEAERNEDNPWALWPAAALAIGLLILAAFALRGDPKPSLAQWPDYLVDRRALPPAIGIGEAQPTQPGSGDLAVVNDVEAGGAAGAEPTDGGAEVGGTTPAAGENEGAVSAPATPTVVDESPAPAAPTTAPTTDAGNGDDNDASLVLRVQRNLIALGHDAPEDGALTPAMRRAVRAFQTDAGVRVNGAVTARLLAQTEAALERKAVRDAGPVMIRLIQQELQRIGINPGPVDGVYGPLTRAGIAQFQQQAGLAADGRPTPAVRDALARAGR